MPHPLSQPNTKNITILILVCLAFFYPSHTAISAPDASKPDSLGVIGYLPPWSSLVAAAGDYVYIGAGNALLIYSVAGENEPALISHLFLPDTILDLVLEDSLIYVLIGSDRSGTQLWNISVSNPARPITLSIYSPYRSVNKIDVEAHLVYLLGDGLLIVDETDPYRPGLISLYENPTTMDDLAVSNHLIFVATFGGPCNSQESFIVIDAVDPMNPHKIAEILLTSMFSLLYTSDMVLEDNRVILAKGYPDGGGIFVVIDISDPLHPIAYPRIGIPHNNYTEHPSIAVSGNFVYTACKSDNLEIYDISDPNNIVKTDFIFGYHYDLAVVGNRLFAAMGSENLRLYSLADQAHPTLIQQAPGVGRAEDMIVSGDLFYVVGDGNTDVFDLDSGLLSIGTISTPGTETILSTVLGGHSLIIENDGNAYTFSSITAIRSGETIQQITVFDLSNPTNPTSTINYYLQDPFHRSNGRDMAVSSQKVYLTSSSELIIISLENPGAITEEYFPIGSSAMGLDLVGHYLYVVGNGLQIYDLDLASSPTLVGSYPLTFVTDVAVSGGIALVTRTGSYAEVLDVSDPAHILPLGSVNPNGDAQRVIAAGNKMVLAVGESGVRVVDISQPDQSFISASYDTPGFVKDIAVNDRFIFAADEKLGLLILTEVYPYAYLPLVAGSPRSGH